MGGFAEDGVCPFGEEGDGFAVLFVLFGLGSNWWEVEGDGEYKLGAKSEFNCECSTCEGAWWGVNLFDGFSGEEFA